MKKTNKIISLLLAGLMLTACFASCDWGAHPVPEDGRASSETFTPHKFGVDDTAVGDIRLGMTPDHVKKLLGEPKSEELVTTDNFIYGPYIKMEFDNLNLLFYDLNEGEDYTLSMISTNTDKVKFAGGLHVGSTRDDVLEVFTHEDDPKPLYFDGMEESCGDYIYGEYNSTQFVEFKPEGVVQYAYINRFGEDNDNSYMMEYYYYNPLEWNVLKDGYTGDYYNMVFYMEEEGDTVTSILISHDMAM